MAGIDIQHFDVNGKMALSAKTTTSERLHGILLMTESTSREKASPERTDVGATYYFNKNMSTFVDYKINLLDDSDFTKAAKVSTDNIVAVGLNYQF